MQVLFLISRPQSASVLTPLLRACQRRGLHWGCFFTGAGIRVLQDPAVAALVSTSPADVAVCEHSWKRFGGGPCPFPLGSQTDSSALAARALRIISL